jgi:hypothetical protein
MLVNLFYKSMSTAEVAVDEVNAVCSTEARFFQMLFSNFGTEPPINIPCFRKALTDASV